MDPKSDRIAGLDAARFLSACAVVWIHTAESSAGLALLPGCRFAVPFFTAAMVYLQLCAPSRGGGETWRAHATKRLRRLYVPFLLWSVIYLVARLLKHRYFPDSSPLNLGAASLLNGTSHHLWFLPFALMVALAAYVVGGWLRGALESRRQITACGAVLVAVAIGLLPSPLGMDPLGNPVSYFVGMSWGALPAASLAVSAAVWMPGGRSHVVMMITAALFVVAVALQFLHASSALLAAVAGFSLLVASLRVTVSASLSRVAIQAGALSMGIYLAHVLFVEAFQAVRRWLALEPSLATDGVIALLGIICSIAVVLVMRRLPAGRYLLPA